LKLETLLHVTPKSVLLNKPLPLLAPKYRILFLFGSTASRYQTSIDKLNSWH
jgi:hypothetical protein